MPDIITERVASFASTEPEEFFRSREETHARMRSLAPAWETEKEYWKYSIIQKRYDESHLSFKNIPYVKGEANGIRYGKALSFFETHKEFLEQHLVKNNHLRKSFFALLAAATAEPQVLSIDRDQEQPVEIMISGNVGRLLIHIASGARVKIVERDAVSDMFGVHLIEYHIGSGATVHHHSESAHAEMKRVVSRYFFLEKDAVLATLSEQHQGTYLRDEISVFHIGTRSSSRVLGSRALSGTTHSDTRIDIVHQVPETTNTTLYRYVLGGESVGIFGGRITIMKGADKTEADMTTKAILESDLAKMYGEPQLEIFTDDVICTHGASTGTIDEAGLLYLQSRGIGRDEGKRLLTESFLAEPYSLFK